MDYEKLRNSLEQKIREKVLGREEVHKIVSNLGVKYAINTVAEHLRDKKIKPKEYGITAYVDGRGSPAVFYAVADVWNYLQEMQTKGKINFQEHGIKSLQDLIDKNYHKTKIVCSVQN